MIFLSFTSFQSLSSNSSFMTLYIKSNMLIGRYELVRLDGFSGFETSNTFPNFQNREEYAKRNILLYIAVSKVIVFIGVFLKFLLRLDKAEKAFRNDSFYISIFFTPGVLYRIYETDV